MWRIVDFDETGYRIRKTSFKPIFFILWAIKTHVFLLLKSGCRIIQCFLLLKNWISSCSETGPHRYPSPCRSLDFSVSQAWTTWSRRRPGYKVFFLEKEGVVVEEHLSLFLLLPARSRWPPASVPRKRRRQSLRTVMFNFIRAATKRLQPQ